MQTLRPLALCLFGVALGTLPSPAVAQEEAPPDPELGFLPPAEDLPDTEDGTGESSEPEVPPAEAGAVPPPAGDGDSSGRGLAPRSVDSQGRRGQQTQVLARHQLRIEFGPTDFALRDSGFLGEGRGLRLGRADVINPGQEGFYGGFGWGLSVGVYDNLEVGVLQLPVILDNGYGTASYGNLEVHARYGAVRGDLFEIGVQLVLQAPTHNAFGVGFGMPVRLFATDELVIDTGLELEILKFTGDLSSVGNAVNLDLPIAVNYFFVPEAFAGLRTGLFVLDFDDLYFPLGVQGGYALMDGMIQLMGWFQWAAVPLGEIRFSNEYLDAGSFEFGLGCNVLLDFSH